MYYIGIDQSKRSTGVCIVNEAGSLIDYKLIANNVLDGVELIRFQWEEVKDFIDDVITSHEDIKGALIEGLSFGSVGSGKDFLAGLQWFFRCKFEIEYGVFLGTIPVTMWRSKVLSKEEQKDAKYKGKDGQKWACVGKLPAQLEEKFVKYVATCKAKKASLFDLADAYFIAQHCRKLSTSK